MDEKRSHNDGKEARKVMTGKEMKGEKEDFMTEISRGENMEIEEDLRQPNILKCKL